MKQRAQSSKAAGRLPGLTNNFAAFGAPARSGCLAYLDEPPSLDAVSDPNVVVSLKNVLKKDSITKAKALEDLLQHAQAHPFEKDGGVEEAVLHVWAQIYPRISIDNSRRVRELSHTLQLELVRSARKRIVKYIPKMVPAWLSGLYDRDRAAARAANEGLSSYLSTPEKQTAFWRKCQPQILDYAIDAIRETADSLSDERSTSKEDAEAKYLRVVSAALSLVLGLLEKLDDADIAQFSDRYSDFFAEETVWKSITFNDSSARKMACQLLIACLDRKLPYADSPLARQAMVTGGLKTTQSGSALEYTRALTRLTQASPDMWRPGPKEKRPALSRLHQFIAKGSQGCSADFWGSLHRLLAALPEDQLRDLAVASGTMSAIKSGILSREEPRTHASAAWRCYVETAKHISNLLSDDDDRLVFVEEHLFPLFDQFIISSPDKPTPGPLMAPSFLPSLVEAHLAIIRSTPSVVSASGKEWDRLTEVLCGNISSSLPEVSREYQSSQERVSEEGRRWFALVGEIQRTLSETGEILPDHTTSPSHRIIAHSISRLQNRDMKPFGAARILEYALSTSRPLFAGESGEAISSFLRAVADESIDKALRSASSGPLLSCLRLLSDVPSQESSYEDLWRAWVGAVLDVPDRPVRTAALVSLISQEKGSRFAHAHARLQESILAETTESVKGGASSWELLAAAITYHGLTDESRRSLAQSLIQCLDTQAEEEEKEEKEEKGEGTDNALRALEIVVKGQPQLFAQDEALHTALVAHLLGLTEIGDGAVSSKALAIRSLLEGEGSGTLPAVGIIHSNLERAGPQSLDVSTLVLQAHQAFDADVPVVDIFPSTNAWMQKLGPFLEQPLNPSLSITNALGGALALSNRSALPLDLRTIPRDRKGRSVPLRMALYMAQLFEENLDKSKLPIEFQIELLYIQCLTLQLATDQLNSRDHNGLWLSLDEPESVTEAEGFVASLRRSIGKSSHGAKWWDESAAAAAADDDDDESRVLRGLVQLMREESRQWTPRGVYSARAFSEIVSSLAEAQGLPAAFEESFVRPALARATPETALFASALLSGLGETLRSSKLASNFCNRLVSDVAGAGGNDDDETLMLLSLLTLTARIYDAGELPVPANRLVFAVKQMASWLEAEAEGEQLSAPLCAEMCRVLALLLPCMSSVFGSWWEKSIEFSIDLWEKAARYPLPDALPFIHASLRLVKALETIAEPNEDLHDALRQSAGKKSKSLIELLRLPRGGTSKPLDIVDAMLCREVDKIDIRHIGDFSDIFELVASESRDIQSAAFGLLHRVIPPEQEKRSFEALLDKTSDARLPDELLSLLLDAPTLDKFSDEALAQFPSTIRCYLLSWKLVFDAYSGSPFTIRNDITESLKTEKHASHLLDFTFDVLGHSAAQPLNLEREHITTEQICEYDIQLADSEPEEKSMQWLLVHLFYLTLKYTPGLFKSWYLDCTSKQTRKAVEAWTARYFSPLIISHVLDEVQAWSDEQQEQATGTGTGPSSSSSPSSPEDQGLVIKVSKTGREVTAGYEVDESLASIAIKIPGSYPIDSITVSSVSRVAVGERKWQGWIMTTQGVIAFSGGNIIDGLQVFKRNIVGALRGQVECSICYSIIAPDKKTPDKKCGTCKNLFHRTCLYKWFQTSSHNTCPLCRNPIEYLGSDSIGRRSDPMGR